MTFRAIITGATGMVGEGVLLECLSHPAVEQILVINRKPGGLSHWRKPDAEAAPAHRPKSRNMATNPQTRQQTRCRGHKAEVQAFLRKCVINKTVHSAIGASCGLFHSGGVPPPILSVAQPMLKN